MRTTIEPIGKGHFEVEFQDEFCGLAIYDKSLSAVIEVLSKLQNEPEGIRRIVKTITWVEEDA